MKKIAIISLTIIVVALAVKAVTHCTPPDKSKLQAGDIVFQLTNSRQAPLVEVATMSQKTHCGIVVE